MQKNLTSISGRFDLCALDELLFLVRKRVSRIVYSVHVHATTLRAGYLFCAATLNA